MGPAWLWLLGAGILPSVYCQPFPAHGDKSLGVPRAPGDQFSMSGNPAYHKITPTITNFALRLYKQLAAETSGNIFFSPVSISTSLALLSLGAQADTPAQILEGLGFNLTEIPEADIHRGFQSLIHTLDLPSPKLELKVGNSLFLDKQRKPRQHFLDTIRELYGAFAFSANFTDSATTRKQINEYVRKQTYGQVADSLQEFTQDTLMILLNYIFFKGEGWLGQQHCPLHHLQSCPWKTPVLKACSCSSPCTDTTFLSDYFLIYQYLFSLAMFLLFFFILIFFCSTFHHTLLGITPFLRKILLLILSILNT